VLIREVNAATELVQGQLRVSRKREHQMGALFQDRLAD
jgi:hypothetical protein